MILLSESGKANMLAIVVAVIIITCIVAYAISMLNSEEVVTNETPVSRANTSNEENLVEEPAREDVDPEEIDRALSTGDFEYTFLKLENEIAKKTNIIYSPLSIRYALDLLNEGAEGDTKAEIEKVIGDRKVTKYDDIEKVLSTANAVFIKEDFKDRVLDSYTDAVKEKFGAETIYDKFETPDKVNKWVSDKTFKIIENFLSKEQIKMPNLKMILINALAIDMKWESDFDTTNTWSGVFDKDGKNLDVAFMKKAETYSESIAYKQNELATVLAMDLEEQENGVQLEFDAIMPNDMALDEFISSESSENIEFLLSDLTKASELEDGLTVIIPKFDFDYSIQLKQELMDMGIKEAFDQKAADFSNITGDKSLFVGDAIHKADIEFSEEGIRAAAVTAFMMLEKSALMEPKHPVIVKIDKPFMFVIRDKATGEVWFVGTVYEPVLWKEVEKDYR